MFWCYDQLSAASNQHLIRSGLTGIVYASNPNGLLGYYDGTPPHHDGPADILGAQYGGLLLDAGALIGQFRRGGADVGAAAVYDGTFDLNAAACWIGNDSTGVGDLIANLSELLIYDRVLAANEVASLEAYLAARYGL